MKVGILAFLCTKDFMDTAYSGRFIPILHEYVMVVKKDAGLIVPVLLTEKKECDIRDLPEATWRDVVVAVMEPCKEAVPLSRTIYHK